MGGMYNGLQIRIKDIEPSAAYVHCSAHNLNLVVNDAVKEITEMEIFFDVVQRVFVFFGHSIVRWRILSDLIKESNSQNGLLIKKLNPTRWAGHYEAVFALKIRFVEIQKALTKVILCSSKLFLISLFSKFIKLRARLDYFATGIKSSGYATEQSFGQKHPTIWKLIRKIKNEVAADLAKLALNDVGEPFNKRKILGLTQTTEKRLKELCTRIQNDEINVEDFLKAIAHNIRKRCND
ncbi:hypothetical protein QTP88_022768 [Uroleucon formosanum]